MLILCAAHETLIFTEMIAYFLAGFVLGTFFMWLLYISVRRQVVILDEEKQMLQQEKQIVVEFMHGLVEGIGEGVDRHDLFQRIVHAAVLSTGALSACVYECIDEDETLHTVAVEGLFPPQRALPESFTNGEATRVKFIEQVLKSEVFEMGEGLVGSVAKSGEAVLIKDASKDPRVLVHKEPILQVRSMIIVPIRFRDKILGLLAVANPIDGMAFNETDLSLMKSLADQAGMAIHNSDYMALQIEKNKMDFDLSLASSIQGMLLPQELPKISGLGLDTRYLPAQQVGGDLFDVFDLKHGKIGIAIADVSGKGVPASLLMAMCQTHLRHCAERYDTPSLVLKEMNDRMTISTRQDMFVTLIYAIIDINKSQITFARAGHELPLLLKEPEDLSKKHVEAVGSEGMALGMVPSKIFDKVIEDKTIPFKSGDLFVMYTDGVTEVTDMHGVEFSTERLCQVIEELADNSVADINTKILGRVERFAQDGHKGDDITLVTVKRL